MKQKIYSVLNSKGDRLFAGIILTSGILLILLTFIRNHNDIIFK